jgi:hypothetical protein
VQYLGQKYGPTFNNNFINNELILLRGKDTIRMNVKLPFDSEKEDTINEGILYRCSLKTDKTYTIKLKPATPKHIPAALNSYYKLNAVFPRKRSSRFEEIRKTTEYMRTNPGKYVDIDHHVYELLEIWPDTDCAFE